MAYLFAAIYLLAGITAAMRPKLGVQMVWFLTWLYPIGLLHGLLPLGVRFDDLYVVWILLIALCVRPSPIRRSYVVIFACLWFVSLTLGNLVGVATGGGLALFLNAVRAIGKVFYIPAIAIAIWKTTRSEADIRGHLMAMLIALLGAGVVGGLQLYRPGLVVWWEIPSFTYGQGYTAETFGVELRRAGGAMGAIGYGWGMMTLFVIGARMAVLQSGTITRLLGAAGIAMGAAGMAFSNTRAALGGAAVALVYMIVGQKRRGWLIVLMSLGASYAVLQTNLLDRVLLRFGGGVSAVESAFDTRSSIWMSYLTRPSLHYFLFGRGWHAERERIGESAHSSYIGVLAYQGLFGVVVTLLGGWWMWRAGQRAALHEPPNFHRGIGESARALLLAIAFAGLFGEEVHAAALRPVVALALLAELTAAYRWHAKQQLMPQRRQMTPQEIAGWRPIIGAPAAGS